MEDRMHVVLAIIGFVLLVVICCAIDGCTERDERANIVKWASQHDYGVAKCERTYLDNGPFWYRNKNEQMFRIAVDDHGKQRVFYWRSGLFSPDIEEYH